MKRTFLTSSLFPIISILVSSILLSGCSPEEREDNDLKEMNLNGKVKSTRVISYEAIDKFGEISKGKRKRKVNTMMDKYILFNEGGNEIEMNLYKSDGNLSHKVFYQYDEKGNLIEMNWYRSDESHQSKTLYEYDDMGNKIVTNRYKPDGSLSGKTLYLYDDKGNKIESNWYLSDGSLGGKNTYNYDNRGNNIKSNTYDSNGTFNQKTTYNYDEEGNLIEYNNYLSDGALILKTTYTYDVYKNIIGKARFDAYGLDIDGNQYEATTYMYDYDNKNNWIKQIIFVNKTPKFIIEREIEYYK